MKRDEPYNPSIQGKSPPEGLIFRVATINDCQSIANLMAERNPSMERSRILENTDREILRSNSESLYKLYVADLKGAVIGFCRFYHSSTLSPQKRFYPSPEGWYGMGIMVSPQFRRQHIAQFLYSSRVEVLKGIDVRELYSIVDSNNLTSMRMHQKFGYAEIERASGFLHMSFNDGVGCLFKLMF